MKSILREKFMRRLAQTVLIGLGFGAAVVPSASMAEGPKTALPAISVTDIKIAKPVDPKLKEGLMVAEPGIELHLLVNVPERDLIEFDSKNPSIKSFVDDKGTNLLAKFKDKLGTPGVLVFPRISQDGHRATAQVSTFVAPADGATKLILKGAIPATCGTGLKTFRQANVALTEGTKLKLGTLDLEIGSPSSSVNGAAKVVQLKADMSLRKVKAFRFLNAGNKPIKSQQCGSSSSQRNGVINEARDFGLFENAESLTIEVDMMTQTEVVQIPISLEVGVGLGAGVPSVK